MENGFAVGVPVQCKHGIGKINYLEDGLMSITLRDGTEREYWAPFEGKVSLYVEPPKPVKESELPIWAEILDDAHVARFLTGARIYFLSTSLLVHVLGGRATANWEDLAPHQKVTILGVYLGLPVSIIKEAKENGQLEQLLANR